MNDWTSGYVAELDYTSDFFHDMTPTRMALATLAQGQRHGLDEAQLTYCELGCGHGFTANIVAASNPHIDVHAMDFNPSHIAGARLLAKEADLPNVTFYERSFDDFGDAAGLPEMFDIITLHGVMSWVSEENQNHIVNFISQRLKPGGLVYVSYNSQPGWAGAMPLRQLLTDHAANGSGPLEQRIDDALEYAETLREAGAHFFTQNPHEATRLRSMRTMSRQYLAHEFFNRDWTPFHFSDLAAKMAGAKLDFVGSSNIIDNFEDLCFTEAQLAVLSKEPDPIRREVIGDLMHAEQFRTDLFIRGKAPQTERGAVAGWFKTAFTLTRRYTHGPIKPEWRGTAIDMSDMEYDAFLKALAGGPATLHELMANGVFGHMTWAQITKMISILIGAKSIAPCLPADKAHRAREACRRFNLAVCNRAEELDQLRFLASPVTGGGIEVNRLEQLFLLARHEGHETPAAWAAFVWQILAPQGQRMEQDGRTLETAEENLAVLQARAQSFAARKLDIFVQLGLSLDEVDQPMGEMATSSAA